MTLSFNVGINQSFYNNTRLSLDLNINSQQDCYNLGSSSYGSSFNSSFSSLNDLSCLGTGNMFGLEFNNNSSNIPFLPPLPGTLPDNSWGYNVNQFPIPQNQQFMNEAQTFAPYGQDAYNQYNPYNSSNICGNQQNNFMQMFMMMMQMMMEIMMRMMGSNTQQQNPYNLTNNSGAYAYAGPNGAYASAGGGQFGGGGATGTWNNNTPSTSNNTGSVPANKPDYIATSDWNKIKQLDPKMQANVCKLYEKAHERGLTFHISSGFRSHEQQEYLYKTSKPGYAAKPGTSQHEFGKAIDIQASDETKHLLGQIWKDEMGLKWGQTFANAPEDWHFDMRAA